MKILIIEDDNGQAETLAKLLRAQRKKANDLDIVCAETLHEGLDIVPIASPDVVLLDPGLPDMPTWMDSLKYIRQLPQPVIIVTGLPDPNLELMKAAYQHGAEDVFHKPFCTTLTDRLLSALTSAVLRHRARTSGLVTHDQSS